MSEAVEKILSNYAGESPGVIGNLRRLFHTGTLAGTGKMVILPVDQGFEHGPGRSFEPNRAGSIPSTTRTWRSRPAATRTRRRSGSSMRSPSATPGACR